MTADTSTDVRAGAATASPRATAAATRRDALRALAERSFDVLVIGGGITGAGIARDAALRGLSVALVERDDFASGTSSRSSRLIHGGLRYLEHGYIGLVLEASHERRRLLALAPHLVRPLPFTWPVYRGARVARWKLSAGLALYDALSLFRNVAVHQRLSAAEVLEREPALRGDALLGGAVYYDAATNDARLTLANARAAADAGAVVVNHAEVSALTLDGGRAVGAEVRDRLTASPDPIAVRAAAIVNATGPWTDTIRRLEQPDGLPSVRGTKGAHITVPRSRVGNREALTLLSPLDGRVMFVLPAGAHTIIGTTDTETAALPDDVRASESDATYLLESANAFFPRAQLTRADVVSAWAGVRPLIAQGFEEGPTSASREHAIARTAHGVITITGGKLTTFRVMAAEVVDEIVSSTGRRPRRSPTETTPLPGGDIASLAETMAVAQRTIGDSAVAHHLVRAHGSEWRVVWSLAEEDRALREPVAAGLPAIAAELVYGVEREMARTLGDLLIRRTPIAFETRDQGRSVAAAVARRVAPLLGWNDHDLDAALADYECEVQRIFALDPS